jgi:hypothetical protein
LATKTALPKQYNHNNSTKKRNNKNGHFKQALYTPTGTKHNRTASIGRGATISFATA